MVKAKREKPKKPYPTFPLTAHPNGQWCKKICGKVHFFGVWADQEAALDRYHTVAADLHAGRMPSESSLSGSELTVKELSNRFLNWQRDKMESGEIGARWFEDCRTIVGEFAQTVGKLRLVADLRPDDFQRYRTRLAKRLGVHALTRHLTVIKGVFKYAYDMDLIEHPIKFGRGFAKPTAAQERKARQKAELTNGKKLFTREELLSILDSCDGQLRAAVLLGMNGGFGNTDIATLPHSAIDWEDKVISYARPKTGVQRTVPLWLETAEALKHLLAAKPSPEDDSASRLVFLSPRGKPLVRQRVRTSDEGVVKASNIDRLSADFSSLLTSLGLRRPRTGFYTLRHTFRTWADETNDQHAIHRIMGHAIPGMSGVYVEDISIDRLRSVVEHVRSMLFNRQ